MQLGMIGLGRMGANLVRRLMRDGHDVRRLRREQGRRSNELAGEGATGAFTVEEFVAAARRSRGRSGSWSPPRSSTTPSTSWSTTSTPGDIIIDGGNSYYRDDVDRAARLKPQGIHYVDVGTSGGVFGLDRGFCLMIGGEDDVVTHLDPIFKTIAPGVDAAERTPGLTGDPSTAENGYLHCGPNGAGHFVKMVHNGIEYGIMAATPRASNILHHADVGTSSSRPTPRPRRCGIRSTTSTTSTSRPWPRCGGAAASSPAGCSTSPRTRCRRTTTCPTSKAACPTAARAAGPSTPRSTKASPPTC